jgi:hypothetical protein
MKLKSLLLGLIAAFVFVGCAAEPEAAAPTGEANSAAKVETGGSTSEPVAFKNKDGKLVCPMMGVEMKDESEAVGYVDHEGTRYFMCCDSCLKMGKNDSAKVAEKAAGM